MFLFLIQRFIVFGQCFTDAWFDSPRVITTLRANVDWAIVGRDSPRGVIRLILLLLQMNGVIDEKNCIPSCAVVKRTRSFQTFKIVDPIYHSTSAKNCIKILSWSETSMRFLRWNLNRFVKKRGERKRAWLNKPF